MKKIIVIMFLLFCFSSCFAAADNKKEAEFYFNQSLSKFLLKDYVGAIQDFSKAFELNPKNVEAYYNRGFSKSGVFSKDDLKGDIQGDHPLQDIH